LGSISDIALDTAQAVGVRQIPRLRLFRGERLDAVENVPELAVDFGLVHLFQDCDQAGATARTASEGPTEGNPRSERPVDMERRLEFPPFMPGLSRLRGG
jgi:hypothetical protein